MNKLREQYCDETNTPIGLDNVYDYVKWLETKLNKQVELLQFIQTAVVGRSEQFTPAEIVHQLNQEETIDDARMYYQQKIKV